MSAVLKPNARRELLLGCGTRRTKGIWSEEIPEHFENLVTLDLMATHKPDVEWDMNDLPLPFDDNSFDEIHAYEVLEHTGQQGDWRFFFAQFNDFWRILRPGGYLCASVPMWDQEWAWGDPGHTRVITPKTLMFLEQEFYKQKGNTAASDYRPVYHGNFEAKAMQEREFQFFFILKAIK